MGSDSPFGVRYGSDGYGVGPGVWTNGSDPVLTPFDPYFMGLEAPEKPTKG